MFAFSSFQYELDDLEVYKIRDIILSMIIEWDDRNIRRYVSGVSHFEQFIYKDISL